MCASKSKTTTDVPSPFKKVLPGSLKVGKDKLMMRLDFYGEAIVMQQFDEKVSAGSFKLVDAHDIAKAISREINFGSGILPENTLWWENTSSGPIIASWLPPQVRRLALQKSAEKVERYQVPLPGLIFLCRPGRPPCVFAAARRPTGQKDKVFKAPLCNIFRDGRSCGGNNRYPQDVGGIPESFLRSFFTDSPDVIANMSKLYPDNIVKMWKRLDKEKAKEYPLSDLVYFGTVDDLMKARW